MAAPLNIRESAARRAALCILTQTTIDACGTWPHQTRDLLIDRRLELFWPRHHAPRGAMSMMSTLLPSHKLPVAPRPGPAGCAAYCQGRRNPLSPSGPQLSRAVRSAQGPRRDQRDLILRRPRAVHHRAYANKTAACVNLMLNQSDMVKHAQSAAQLHTQQLNWNACECSMLRIRC